MMVGDYWPCRMQNDHFLLLTCAMHVLCATCRFEHFANDAEECGDDKFSAGFLRYLLPAGTAAHILCDYGLVSHSR